MDRGEGDWVWSVRVCNMNGHDMDIGLAGVVGPQVLLDSWIAV